MAASPAHHLVSELFPSPPAGCVYPGGTSWGWPLKELGPSMLRHFGEQGTSL